MVYYGRRFTTVYGTALWSIRTNRQQVTRSRYVCKIKTELIYLVHIIYFIYNGRKKTHFK